MIFDLAFVVAVALVTSFIVSGAMIWIGPVDAPDEERKQHRGPTRTSGGIGIGAGYGAAMVVISLFSLELRHTVSPGDIDLIWGSSLFAYPLLFVGYVDDARNLNAGLKFLIYSVIALGAAWFMGAVADLPIGDLAVHLPFAVALIGTALWVFTLLNVVNFMDGANGMAMGSVAVGLVALSILALEGGAEGAAAMALCGVGALVGFLAWNYPAGKLFAGDSGALFAGALAAFGCLAVIHHAGMSPIVAPILFFPLLADSLLTLLDRARRRRSLMVGHTEHIYQLAIRAGWSHAAISATYWVATAVCGSIAVFVSRDETNVQPLIALAAMTVAAIVLDIIVRRRSLAAGILQP